MKISNKLAKIGMSALLLTTLVAPAAINTTTVHADTWSDVANSIKEGDRESEEQFGNHNYGNTGYQTNNNNSSNQNANNQNSTNNNSNNIITINGVIKVNNPAKSYVSMVSFNDDGTASPVTNRALVNNTPWQTDRSRTLNGIIYYRVSTNEWVSETYITNYEVL